MKLIEVSIDSAKLITVKWDTGYGEIFIEITPNDTGLDLYCDGEGSAELNYTDNDCCDAITIQPELSER